MHELIDEARSDRGFHAITYYAGSLGMGIIMGVGLLEGNTWVAIAGLLGLMVFCVNDICNDPEM